MANTVSNTQGLTAAKQSVPARKPNEKGTISVQAHLRIYDPKTQKTFVEGRA
jgi:hypothetical protein